jgi:site-specific recombinase XerD
MHEVLSLNHGDVFNFPQLGNPVASSLRVIGKGNKARYVFLTQRTREMLENYHKELAAYTERIRGYVPSPTALLFVMSARSVQKRFEMICEKAGILRPYLCPHSLRHTYATRLLRKGIDPLTVSVSLGHKSLETTMGYLHTNPDHLRRIAAALEPPENPITQK